MNSLKEKDLSCLLFLAINFLVRKAEQMLRFFSLFDQNSVQNSSFSIKYKLMVQKHMLFIAS